MTGIHHDTTPAALLSAAILNYRNPTPRLAYADCLMEAGDPFGRFVHLSQLVGAEWDQIPGECSVLSRESVELSRLYRDHGGNWLGPMWQRYHDCRFERGLLVLDSNLFDAPAAVELAMAPRLPSVAGVRVLAQSNRAVAGLKKWLEWDQPGLLEVVVRRDMLPQSYSRALAAFEVVPPSVNVIRFRGSYGAGHRTAGLDASWADELLRDVAVRSQRGHRRTPVLETCRVEVLVCRDRRPEIAGLIGDGPFEARVDSTDDPV